MNRSPIALQWVALCAAIAVIAGLAATVVSPSPAEAQDSTSASLTLQVSEPVADQPFRTAAIALDPGTSGLAALGATLTFHTADVTVTSCAVSEAGACNVLDGEVLVSVFNLARLQANDQLLTINFEVNAEAARTTTFAVAATTAVTSQGTPVDAVVGDALEVEVTATTFGSLTGTVVAADTETALFNIDVCAVSDATGAETCTTTSGLGNWRIDDLETGTYGVVASDMTDVYATTVESGFVTDGDISSVADIAMAYFTPPVDQEEDDSDAVISENTTEPEQDTTPVNPAPAVVVNEPVVVQYEASIAGRVTGIQTESPIVAAQVCATQPLVLHQSCATTDANGEFLLSGLSTGNYWVEVVDPLAQFEQARPKLVGVVGDDAARSGVNIALTSVAE